jgi:hypothetical protein
MGNSCCNNGNKDPHNKDYGNKKMNSEMNELMVEAKKNEEKIVKIQAGFRGYKARKDFKDENDNDKNKPK